MESVFCPDMQFGVLSFRRDYSSNMFRPERTRLSQLNPHLICVLCGGYLIDATTIIRCLHTFCRTCIVHYLQSSNHCPVCAITVQKKNPFSELRPDKILQDIVYKVVPGLFRDEMNRRRESYMKNDKESTDGGREHLDASATSTFYGERVIVSPDDKISLSLEFCPNGVLSDTCEETTIDEQMVENRYLLCPAAVSVGNLKKFLRMKFSLSDTFAVDMYYEDEVLRDEYRLVDVAYISSWSGKDVLKLLYSIYENPAKRMKRAKSIDSVRCNNDDSGIEDGNQSFESSPSVDSSLLNDSGQGLDCDMNKCETEPKADDSVPCDTNVIMKAMKENHESAEGGEESKCAAINGNSPTSYIVGEADALEAVVPVAEALFKDEEDDVVIEKLDETVSRIIAEGDNNDTEHSLQDVSCGSVPCVTLTPPHIQRRFSNASTETEPISERRFSNASTETDQISERRFSNASTETDDQICDLSVSKTVEKSESEVDSKNHSIDKSQNTSTANSPNTSPIEHTQAQTQTFDSKTVVNQSTDFGMQTTVVTSDKQCSDKGIQHNGCDSQNHVKNSNHVTHSKNSPPGHAHDSPIPCSGVCNGHSVKSRGPEKLVVKLSKEKDSESYTATSNIT